MAQLTIRKNISLSGEESRRLKELAQTNTDGNEAMLIRILINRTHQMPQEHGMLPPIAIDRKSDE